MRHWHITVLESYAGGAYEPAEYVIDAQSFTVDPLGNGVFTSPTGEIVGFFRNVVSVISRDDEISRDIARLEKALDSALADLTRTRQQLLARAPSA